MIQKLSEKMEALPEAAEIIQQAIDKLTEYENRLETVPANIVATREISVYPHMIYH